MSGFLLDTCVISEFKKPRPNAGLFSWLESVDVTTTYLSALTIGELRYGISRLPKGKKRTELERWLASEIIPGFPDRVLPITSDVTDRWGRLRAQSDALGKTLSPLDALIAATAVHYNLTLITRNEKHFPEDLTIINPWTNATPRD